MTCLNNTEPNIIIKFDFLDELPGDFYGSNSNSEKWVQFVMSVITPDREISFDESSYATLSVFEIERIAAGLGELLSVVGGEENRTFSHFCCEAYFEVRFEYYHEDDLFGVELWINSGALTAGKIAGFDTGYRFDVEVSEMANFSKELRERFHTICPERPQ